MTRICKISFIDLYQILYVFSHLLYFFIVMRTFFCEKSFAGLPKLFACYLSTYRKSFLTFLFNFWTRLLCFLYAFISSSFLIFFAWFLSLDLVFICFRMREVIWSLSFSLNERFLKGVFVLWFLDITDWRDLASSDWIKFASD